MKRFLLCSVLVAVILADCLNDCSGYGDCVGDTCQCYENRGGSDCSVSDVQLTSGVTTHGSVGTREWTYYHIFAMGQSSELVVQVNQTSLFGDCDTYLRENNYPTRNDYDERDISTSKHSQLTIDHPSGTYFIGVYGFLGAEFDIQAFLKTDCVADCSGHGQCVNDGECACEDGWAGDDCSSEYTEMTANVTYDGFVEKTLFNYYAFNNDQNTMQIEIHQTGEGDQDCDLYVKYGELPTLNSFDQRDTTVSDDHIMKVPEATIGEYFIGVYGFKACNYNIQAFSYSECPNKCSDHGACDGLVTCRCAARFDGDGCETMISPLTYDSPQTGYVDTSNWNYYHFTPRSTSNILVNLVQAEDGQDCDVYIRINEEPTRFEYEYRDISFDSNFTITIENPAFEVHYIGVLGYKECRYTLKTHVTKDCPNDCTDLDHGVCQDGHCLCKEGYTGDDCSEDLGQLTLDTTVEGVAPANEWVYYQVDVKAGLEVTILMRETNSTGYLWLYESRDGYPSMASYDNSDTETNSNTHDVVFTPESDVTVQIGVFGSPLTVPGNVYGYKLVVWQASFRLNVREVKL